MYASARERVMSNKPETYLITFEMTTTTDPAEWDWDALLDVNVDESYTIHSIGQITRNNKEVA
jgi:hypothetical protein